MFNVRAFCTYSSVLKTWLGTRMRASYERGSPKHTNMCVYVYWLFIDSGRLNAYCWGRCKGKESLFYLPALISLLSDQQQQHRTNKPRSWGNSNDCICCASGTFCLRGRDPALRFSECSDCVHLRGPAFSPIPASWYRLNENSVDVTAAFVFSECSGSGLCHWLDLGSDHCGTSLSKDEKTCLSQPGDAWIIHSISADVCCICLVWYKQWLSPFCTFIFHILHFRSEPPVAGNKRARWNMNNPINIPMWVSFISASTHKEVVLTL